MRSTPRAPSLAGAPSGRAPFLILPVGYSLSDVKWLLTDPEAEVDRMLALDGKRRRWLGAGVAGPASKPAS